MARVGRTRNLNVPGWHQELLQTPYKIFFFCTVGYLQIELAQFFTVGEIILNTYCHHLFRLLSFWEKRENKYEMRWRWRKYETSMVRRRWQILDKGELSSGSPLSKNSELLPTIPAEIKLFTTSPTKNGLNQISQHTSSPTPTSTVTTGGNPKKATQFWLLVKEKD